MKEHKIEDQTITQIPLEQIHMLENSRVNYGQADFAELMGSIKQHGLMQPIGVRVNPKKKNEYELLYGNRRYLAIKKLGWHEIPCIIVDSTSKDDFIVKNLVENMQRVNLSPFEEGRYYSMLKKMGLSISEIAMRMNLTEKKISNALTIFEHIPEEFRESIINNRTGARKKNQINANVAAKLLLDARGMGKNKKEISVLLRHAKEGRINVHQTNRTRELMRAGLSAQEAVDQVRKIRTVTVMCMIPEATAEHLMNKYKTSLGQILRRYLEGNPEFKLFKPGTLAKAKFKEPKQLSMDV